MNDEEIPEDINVHKQIWGKDADQVNYGGGEKKKTTSSDVLYVIHELMNSDIVHAEES